MKDNVILALILVFIVLLVSGCEEGTFDENQANSSGSYLVFDRALSWSPDSTKIVYLSNNSLLVRNVMTDVIKQLTGTGYYDDPAWSPNNLELAYMASSFNMKADIWLKKADGTDIARILVSNSAADSHPRWSPDGLRIMFHSYRNGDMNIWIKSSDAIGEETKLTEDAAVDQNAEWSPDGTKFAFESKRADNFDIWVTDIDDPTNLFQLTTNSSADTIPLWSPDGSKIAFKSDRFDIGGIWVKNSDGSGDAIHISEGFDDGDDHDWSADSKYIAFVANGIVYVRSADGTGEPIEIGEGLEPKWSPDGTKMAYVAWDKDQYKVKVMDLPSELR